MVRRPAAQNRLGDRPGAVAALPVLAVPLRRGLRRRPVRRDHSRGVPVAGAGAAVAGRGGRSARHRRPTSRDRGRDRADRAGGRAGRAAPRGRSPAVGAGHDRGISGLDPPGVAANRRQGGPRAGVLLSGTGLLVYCGYQWLRFDNPFAFVATESALGWDQGTGLRVWFKVALVDELRASSSLGQLKLLSAALACLVVVLLLPRIRRRFGWGYAAFTAVVVAIPFVTTKDFFGSGRYMLAAFPAFAAAADFLAKRPAWMRGVVLVLFAVGLAYGMVLYTRGYEVS